MMWLELCTIKTLPLEAIVVVTYTIQQQQQQQQQQHSLSVPSRMGQAVTCTIITTFEFD
jgi:hypothetical protein